MLTYDGKNPYYIDSNGNFNINENGFECAILYCDTNIYDMLNELYEKIENRLK